MQSNWEKGEGIFDEVAEVADGHGTTLLSEAAAGGQMSTLKFLMENGAHPNRYDFCMRRWIDTHQ